MSSAADAVADMSGLRCVDDLDDLQLDLCRQDVEQPATATEQYRNLMDLHFVQHPSLKWLLGEIAFADSLCRPGERTEDQDQGDDLDDADIDDPGQSHEEGAGRQDPAGPGQ